MISEDVFQWVICQDPDYVGLEVMSWLSCAHDYVITYLIHL
jgi:hypothetical protein